MIKYLLPMFFCFLFTVYTQAQTIEQQLSWKLSPIHAYNGQPEADHPTPGNDLAPAAGAIPPASYPPNLYAKSSFTGLLLFLGGGLLGGWIGTASTGETDGLKDDVWPHTLAGVVIGATTLSTLGIHSVSKKHCKSSCWYAAGGIILTLGVATGLGSLSHSVSIAIPAVIFAPFIGTKAYLHYGRPIRLPE